MSTILTLKCDRCGKTEGEASAHGWVTLEGIVKLPYNKQPPETRTHLCCPCYGDWGDWLREHKKGGE